MAIGLRTLVAATIFAAALPIITGADSTTATARSEIRLQFGDLLFGDARYWEAVLAYESAKRGANEQQLLRALSGGIRARLRVAQFTSAHLEANSLRQLAPRDPGALALYGDAMWAAGLFNEAEQAYRDALALKPDEARARNGLAKCLAGQGRLGEALTEIHAALGLVADEAEFHHTLGSIYRRLNRFPEAADAYERYVSLLPSSADSETVRWSRAEVSFLRAFGERVPFELDGDEETLHTVAFRVVNDKVIIRASINGQSPIDMVLDTGAEQTLLSQPVARRIGVQPLTRTLSAGVGEIGLRGLQAGRLDSIQIGTLLVKNLPVLIKTPPLDGLPRREAEAFSPLPLGLSMTIDYKNHHLILGRTLPEEPADIELPLRMYRLATVRGVINHEYPKSFIVDTGGEVISISLASADPLPHFHRDIPLKVYGTSGWDPDAYLLAGVNLAFDTIEYPNFSVIVLNLHRPSVLLGFQIGGIVGHTFLREYRVSIDLNRSVLRLNKL